ncbi:BsuPI-related putative proteinase inhibitor [Haloarchaeobius sp. DYHT-AS-18]|uniref:BsuPI-related putative proteinase inhibitor n=1 Tax=Haloarchaeobius sp. DYHT-AS-18 TaxID=3446117 RepID=UPI003EC108B6
MSLSGTLEAASTDDGVTFTFTVENTGSDPVELQFADGQTHDVLVIEDGDTQVWCWSEGQMFMQMLQQETIAPGDHVTYECIWEDPEPGEYVAEAFLSASNADCEASAEFTV